MAGGGGVAGVAASVGAFALGLVAGPGVRRRQQRDDGDADGYGAHRSGQRFESTVGGGKNDGLGEIDCASVHALMISE